MWFFNYEKTLKEPAIKPITQPVLNLKPNSDRMYILAEPYVYCWLKGETLYRLIIPVGFETDIASVPQIFWSLGLTPDGKQRAASVLHDFLFHCNYEFDGVCPEGTYQKFDELNQVWVNIKDEWTIRQANLLFGRVLRESKVNFIKRRLLFLGVDFFAWTMWQHKKEKEMKRINDRI